MKLWCKLRQAGVWGLLENALSLRTSDVGHWFAATYFSNSPMGVGSNLRKYFYTGKGRNCVQFLPLVGVAGFEPAASWTRTKRDTKLRHTPIARVLYSIFSNVSSALMN